MVAPATPSATTLPLYPPITFTPVAKKLEPFSSRNPRWLFTLNSSGRLSVLPRKCVPGVVLVLPVILHALFKAADGTVPLVNWEALSAVRFEPMPLNWLAGLLKFTALP